MKIAIDIQALQTTNSRNRGIGRYTKSVIEALFSLQHNYTYQLYANKTLPAPELDENTFPYSYINYPYIGSCNFNDLLLKTVLTSTDTDIIFIPSPMEGLESIVPDYKGFYKNVFVICYDLIPLIFADKYLQDANMHSLYMKRLKNISNADFIFAISESTRQDVIKYLNVSPKKVLNISGGISPFFRRVHTNEHKAWLKNFADKFGINKKFILYTGGEDWRKNVEGLLTAFSLLPKSLQECYQLVIACKVSEHFTKKITTLASKQGIDKSIVLTNYISDEELRALYSTCSLFVFPSFYEGFGLPLLEAMSCGAPCVASNNSSLPEIIGDENQLFDPNLPDDIARIMQTILFNENLREKISLEAIQQAAKFSWKSVAKNMIDVFQEHQQLNKISISFNRIKTVNTKPQIAFFSPFPPAKSGIADYSQDLLPSLSKHYDLDLYHDGSYSPDVSVNDNLFLHSQFEDRLQLQEYEGIIYQIGNSSYHSYMYFQIMRYTGISVLHDYYLGGLINYMDAHCPEFGVHLSKEMEHSYGKDRATEILNLLQTGSLNIHEKLPEAGIYINRRIFTRSIGVVLHSRWAYELAIREFTNDNDYIVHIPQLVPKFTSKEKSGRDERQNLGIPDDSFVISTFGFISSTKRPLQILHAFKKYHTNQPNAYLVFVGGTDYLGSINIENEVSNLNLQGHVKVTGYVNMLDFYRYIEVSDICLNLRFPFKGESSASLLRILSVGKPTIVTDIGSFSDFPDDVVLKIPQPSQNNEVEAIFQALMLLTKNLEYRNSLSQNASEYIAREHSPERCAGLYVDFIKQVLCSSQAKRKMLADHVGRELAQIDTNISQRMLIPFAQVIDTTKEQEYNPETSIDLKDTISYAEQLEKTLDFNLFLHECRSICIANIPKSQNILSIGCAGSWYFEWFDKFYPYSVDNHTGIDLNEKPLNLPKNVTWIQHDGQDLSVIESQSFDLLFAGQFIEHISWEAQVSFLLEVNRVMKPDGIFVLDSPNYTISNRYGWKQPEHIHELIFEQICELLEIAGFEIQDSCGLIPKKLLGTPPQLFGKCLKSGLQTNKFSQADIQNAINQDPHDCFVWWVVAKKSKDCSLVNHSLNVRMQEIYLENQKNKNEVVFHQIGSIVEKNQDYFILANPIDGQGFAIFGPYDCYHQGKYLVEFEISPVDKRITKTQLDTIVATADIATNDGMKVIARTEIKLRDLLNEETIKIEFILATSCLVEFRVFYLGKFPILVGIKPKVSVL
ncbi:glycosyltransferase [Nodularia sp. UHCC 0506]|uniref:glycosyltransferase n=1 Tax=Nodularia sp. UHCC 0506 TaxID=3110243 RepID=UPI002B1F896C|nr:glycosyltransferase [Nodularia sp. UHCC 0506]MEA5513691.1 glycosyltransferase [Nodularia sp. UHCC 0506]